MLVALLRHPTQEAALTTRALQRGFLVLTASAVLVAGCNREPAVPMDQSATVAVDDERIATYVQARYQRDRSIRGSDISVTANNGVVTLRGSVPDADAREHAVELAREVDGVQRVDNELQVAPAAAGDPTTADARPMEGVGTPVRTANDPASPGWITTKIQAQYFVNPDVRPWNIDVTTSGDGIVTLRGEVENAADRDEAVRIARETEGVTRVENQLRVRPDTADRDVAERRDTADTARDTTRDGESPDAWITAKVQAKYFLDTDVKGRNINVDTRDGIVTLTGEVESEGERRQALAIARNTDGVKSVTDQLQIQSADADRAADDTRTTRRDTSVGIDDVWITTKVQAKFFLEDDIKGREIDVDSRDGIVFLTGTVESDAERRVAETIALETDGVSRVENQLKVDPAVGRR
jgi:hyperosmotically inducible periplasmic protein